jgi:hypothetical protein
VRLGGGEEALHTSARVEAQTHRQTQVQ